MYIVANGIMSIIVNSASVGFQVRSNVLAVGYNVANGGQYGRHLENVANYGIEKYLVVFLDPENANLDTKIIIVAIVEGKIYAKMYLAAILAAILDFVKTPFNFNTNRRI